MRFLSMIRINENTGQKPTERLMTEMGKLIEEMTKEGTLVRTAGLQPRRFALGDQSTWREPA
jgi:hypothetical protein